ncbi:MAG: DNA mismatch repair protein MutS [Defluviitaleaceae bacterium]|nr:DNA mismatch repair protein MutS [Defluviitaleaceae bacterium]
MNHFKTLEFDVVLNQLADCAISSAAKARCQAMTPASTITDATRLLNQTTEAKNIIDHVGSPPIASMTDHEKIIGLINADALLTTDNIENVATFLSSCNRMRAYLKRAEVTGTDISLYGNAMIDQSALAEEINRCLHNGQIDDRATPRLHDLRRSIERKGEQIKSKIESLLQKNKQYCVDGFVAVRNGRYTMPVKRDYKNKISGILVEVSNTGGTCFIEPTAVSKLQDELAGLKIEEDNEVRTILYTLTALIYEDLTFIKRNMEAMETLDFVFAKAKLSISMNATQIRLTEDREIRLLEARHPLLRKSEDEVPPVPLNFALGNGTRGIIVTGPNTGGKTVAIKTVGLLSLMAQSGLHVPADERSSVCIFDAVWCDIGDGQSISQNLSTFSSHMTNIISVLEKTTENSLILFDELGSGTDPAEGMGIATAILEALLTTNCLFTVTTHYPEIKDFATNTQGVINARMAFDKETLMPLYRLEIGEAGESCALHIAERLGLPQQILQRAREITYSGISTIEKPAFKENTILTVTPLDVEDEQKIDPVLPRSQRFNIGDSVTVYPKKDIGIVYERANEIGEIGVQIKGEKRLINHKRIKLRVSAEELYPPDYDFSIIFDSVENRKARHLMGRKHVKGHMMITENKPHSV